MRAPGRFDSNVENKSKVSFAQYQNYNILIIISSVIYRQISDFPSANIKRYVSFSALLKAFFQYNGKRTRYFRCKAIWYSFEFLLELKVKNMEKYILYKISFLHCPMCTFYIFIFSR